THCCRATRLRHHFPTRRSSDLPLYYIRTFDAAGPAIIDTAFRINVYRVARNNQKLMSGPNAKDVSIRSLNKDSYVRVIARSGDRSEEHTSELQSRENLVCRLLL